MRVPEAAFARHSPRRFLRTSRAANTSSLRGGSAIAPVTLSRPSASSSRSPVQPVMRPRRRLHRLARMGRTALVQSCLPGGSGRSPSARTAPASRSRIRFTADESQPRRPHPQSARVRVRVRPRLLVSSHGSRACGQMVVPGPLLRSASQEPCTRGVEAKSAAGRAGRVEAASARRRLTKTRSAVAADDGCSLRGRRDVAPIGDVGDKALNAGTACSESG